jgi:hypothetical protein
VLKEKSAPVQHTKREDLTDITRNEREMFYAETERNEWNSTPNGLSYYLPIYLSHDILSSAVYILSNGTNKTKQTPWPLSASELYRPSDRRLSTKLVPTFADRGCRVVSATDPYGRILGFLNRCRYFFFQVAPQLYSRGWAVLVLRKSGSSGNRTRTSGSVARNFDH